MINLQHMDLWESYWADRNAEAAAALIRAWMPLVNSTLCRMAINLPSHVRTDDLLQCAVVGLYNSIERFDPKHEVKFETFASRRIKGAILDELRNSDYMTRNSRAWIKKLEDVIQEWIRVHARAPDEAELANALSVSSLELGEILESAQPWMSFDQAVVSTKGGHDMLLKDVIADEKSLRPDEQAQKEDVQKHLRLAFKKLDDREQKIMYLYYFEELRLAEIASLYTLTEARICQIHSMILLKLKVLISEFMPDNLRYAAEARHE